jgi:hypothetical protein
MFPAGQRTALNTMKIRINNEYNTEMPTAEQSNTTCAGLAAGGGDLAIREDRTKISPAYG